MIVNAKSNTKFDASHSRQYEKNLICIEAKAWWYSTFISLLFFGGGRMHLSMPKASAGPGPCRRRCAVYLHWVMASSDRHGPVRGPRPVF